MISSPTTHDTSNLQNRARGYTMSGFGGADRFADRDPRLAQIFHQDPSTQSDSNINYGQPTNEMPRGHNPRLSGTNPTQYQSQPGYNQSAGPAQQPVYAAQDHYGGPRPPQQPQVRFISCCFFVLIFLTVILFRFIICLDS